MATNNVSPKKGKVVDIPSTPTIGTATGGGNLATVPFTAAAVGGPATTFTATSNPDSITGSSLSSPIVVDGLTAGTSYTFTVRGTNATGSSELTTASNSVTPVNGVDFLVIAGGGGGAGFTTAGGGGGAGGFRTSTGTSGENSAAESRFGIDLSTNYTVTVGAGGAGGNYVNAPSNLGKRGSNSVFATITSIGGGGGVSSSSDSNNPPLKNGGSGGGGHNTSPSYRLPGTGTANQGFGGGNGGGSSATTYIAGGGGGAGALGGDGILTVKGGNGGAGIASSITGTSVTYAGGGGGAAGRESSGATNVPGGNGGVGGGGAGGSNAIGSGKNGINGTLNTGGGAGGGGINGSDSPFPNFYGTGGTGGSGVVILRYPSARTITIGAGLTGTTATVGSNKVTTITAGTGNVSWA